MRTPDGFKIDDAAFALVLASISYWGTTTLAGNVGGTTVRCGGLATEPPYDNHALKMLDGPSAGQIRDITLHPAGTDTLTVANALTDVTGANSQVAAGLRFVIISHSPATAEVAAIAANLLLLMADVGDASASTLGSIYAILGNPAAAISVTLQQAYDIVNSMLTLQETGGTLLATAAEQYVYVNDSPLGVYRPVTVLINLDNMVATEQIIVREYYRINPTGNQELKDVTTYDGVDGGLLDSRKLININMEPNRYGCSVTLEMTAYDTAYKTFDWEALVEE